MPAAAALLKGPLKSRGFERALVVWAWAYSGSPSMVYPSYCAAWLLRSSKATYRFRWWLWETCLTLWNYLSGLACRVTNRLL